MTLWRLATNLLLAAVLGIPLTSQADGIDQIARARALLAKASTALRAARDDDTRLAALGRAVTAHEAALSALREGLRAMAVTEHAMARETDAEAMKLRRLLTALQSLSRAPASALLAARGGPLEATRAAMLMAGITPELNRRVLALQQRLAALKSLRDRQEAARTDARAALATLQDLRAMTSEALGRRDGANLITRSELQSQAKGAAARARDLDGLAAALRNAGVKPGAAISIAPLPVAGKVSARFGEPDPWGRPGHGWSIVAPAFAQVTAPWDATVRYAGPLIDYRQVLVLEPKADYLVVIAGLAHIDRTAGEAVLAGEKLGDLGGPLPTGDEFLLDQTAGGGQIRQETLYLEIRRSGEPLDPADWFDATGSEAIQ
jgi:septal ring factor EnvC (AmiA/AmiB activator)